MTIQLKLRGAERGVCERENASGEWRYYRQKVDGKVLELENEEKVTVRKKWMGKCVWR